MQKLTTTSWQETVHTMFQGKAPEYVPKDPPLYENFNENRVDYLMFPYQSNRDEAADVLGQQLLEANLLTTTFADADHDQFFKEHMALYMGELLAGASFAQAFVQHLAAVPWVGITDQFGEKITDNPPFTHEHYEDAAGVSGTTHLEVITTYELQGIPAPAFMLPFYERYLIQHEFGHTIDHHAAVFEADLTYPEGIHGFQTMIESLYAQAESRKKFISYYSAEDEAEFWAEATAIYFSPIPLGSFSSGKGNNTDGTTGNFLTPEALAELIELMHPELYEFVEQVYGPSAAFKLRKPNV